MSRIENFEVIQKIEVLNEVSAGIIADFDRELEKRNIDIEDRNNPVIVLYWQTVKMKNNLICKESLQELKDAEAQLKFVSEYIRKLEKHRLTVKNPQIN